MAHITGVDAYSPKIDYSLSTQEVYVEAAKACMLKQGENAYLDFLRYAQHMPEGSSMWQLSKAVISGEHWPSWLIDWSIEVPNDETQSCECYTVHLRRTRSSASAGRRSHAKILLHHDHKATARINGPCLSVRGIIVLSIHGLLDSEDTEYLQECTDTYPSTSLKYHEAYKNIVKRKTGVSRWLKTLKNPDYLITHPSHFWQHVTTLEAAPASPRPLVTTRSRTRTKSPLQTTATAILSGRAARDSHFFETTAGLIGATSAEVQPGDEIAIVFGVQVPFVVRRNREHNHFLLIGECYVAGIMEGEVMENLDESRVEDLWFW